jgi:AraC family transcriptional regulator
MRIETVCRSKALSVLDYRCTATPHDKPFAEQFSAYSISYVRKGSFGCRSRGRHFEFAPGSMLIGRAGDEYLCTHDHHCGGDACLSFQLAPEFVEQIGGNDAVWRIGGMPPLAEFMVLGELAWAAAEGRSDVGIGEVGLVLAQRFVETASGNSRAKTRADVRQRGRAVEAAVWIDDNSRHALSLDIIADEAGLSPFHFLRVFARVLGVTPHQYLLRSRLRHAAQLLADGSRTVTDVALDAGFNDLSNFVRTFHRAAGMSPNNFRRLARGKRKIFQD